MTTLFKHVLEGIEDNNNINDGSYRDWEDADHAIDTYENSSLEELDTLDDEELEATRIALDRIIETNGKERPQAIHAFNEKIFGDHLFDSCGEALR
jgi:ribosomal protein L16/L10AE